MPRDGALVIKRYGMKLLKLAANKIELNLFYLR